MIEHDCIEGCADCRSLEQPTTLCDLIHGSTERYGYLYLPENPAIETPVLYMALTTGVCPGCDHGVQTRLVAR